MKRAKPVKAVVKEPSSSRLIYAVLFAIAVLIIIAIVISVQTKESDATAWATVRSSELHSFLSSCRDGGGTVDVRPNTAPQIVFSCIFADREVEYTLSPGK